MKRLLLKTVDLRSISGRVKPKTLRIGIHSFPALKKYSVKLPPWVVDRWKDGSLSRRLKGPFAVSWPITNYCQFLHVLFMRHIRDYAFHVFCAFFCHWQKIIMQNNNFCTGLNRWITEKNLWHLKDYRYKTGTYVTYDPLVVGPGLRQKTNWPPSIPKN